MGDTKQELDSATNMNTGDISTLNSQLDGTHAKLSSTLMSYPESARSISAFRPPKAGGTLQLLTELLGQNVKLDSIADAKGNLPTIPINDLRGEEATVYSREECIVRRSLAALYRLVDIRGWTLSIYNHISVRAPDNSQHFLINPFGLLYHEIQASSLVKIDADGNIVQQGSTVLGVNKAGWTLHSALHATRPDVNCIVHIHLPDVIAVSCIRAGLLPCCPEATELLANSGVKYHDYRGILVDEAERASIQSDLGLSAKVLFLRNHGVAVAASSVPEAWYLIKRVVTACQTQMRMLQSANGPSLLTDLKEASTQLTNGATPRPFADLDGEDGHAAEQENQELPMFNGKDHSESGDAPWNPEDLEFEAEMRVLDSAGYRTGHIYRQPNLLRRAPGSAWVGDTLGDPIAGMELGTTDFSATEFSAIDDLTAAESAGAQQKARIADSVKANRLRGSQRNQWLADKRDATVPDLVTSSMLASPVNPTQSTNLTPVRPYAPSSQESPISETPLKRSMVTNTESPTNALTAAHSPPMTSYDGGETLTNGTHDANESNRASRSATLPARGRHSAKSAAYTTNTLQSVDGGVHSAGEDEEKPKSSKRSKPLRSFRIPSFSRKKK